MTPEEVFCAADKIDEGQCFEYDSTDYRRLILPSYFEDADSVIAACTQDHRLEFIARDATVRRCNGFGNRLHTDAEEAAAEESTRRYSLAMNAIEDRVHEAVKADRRARGVRPLNYIKVLYSAYDTDDVDAPIDNLDEVAIKGKCVLAMREDRSYQSEVVENPTWLQLCVLANDMILTTRDFHHVFLEGVELIKKPGNELASLNVPIYEFVMGS